MKVTLYCSPDNSSFQLSFHDWKENRGRMARIDLELLKVLGSAISGGGDVYVISKNFDPGMKIWEVKNKIKQVVKVLNGFMIEPEIKESNE